MHNLAEAARPERRGLAGQTLARLADGSAFGFTLACLPFTLVVRFPPNPGFWGQWMAVSLCLLWLASQRRRSGRLPLHAGLFLVMAAGLLLLTMAGHVASATGALVAVAILVTAAAASATATRLQQDGRAEPLVVGFAWGLLVALAFNAVAALLGWLGYEWQIFVLYKMPQAHTRAVGLMGHANHLGVLAVFALFAALALHAEGRMGRWLLAASVAAASWTCAAASSRVALVIFVAALGITLAACRQRPDASRVRRAVGGAAGGFVAVQLAWSAWNRLNDAGDGATVLITRSADSGRLSMLADAFELWRTHPLAGVGHGRYAAGRLHELGGEFGAPHADHAHNILVQALAEWGSLGGLLVLAGLVLLLWAVVRQLRTPPAGGTSWLASIWVVGIGLHSLVEQPLWFSQFLLPFALFAGLLPQPAAPAASAGVRMPRAVTISLVLAVVVVCVSAADYLRSQTLAMKLLVEGQLPPGEPALVSLAEVAAVDALTLYPQSARMLLSRKLPIDDAAIDAKITITRQSMDAVPSPETIARWSAFCALAGREQEALQLLRPLASRYPPLHHQTLENLARLAGRDARIQALLDTLRAPAR